VKQGIYTSSVRSSKGIASRLRPLIEKSPQWPELRAAASQLNWVTGDLIDEWRPSEAAALKAPTAAESTALSSREVAATSTVVVEAEVVSPVEDTADEVAELEARVLRLEAELTVARAELSAARLVARSAAAKKEGDPSSGGACEQGSSPSLKNELPALAASLPPLVLKPLNLASSFGGIGPLN